MTWNIWQQQFIELNGSPLPSAQVTVRNMSDNSIAVLASDTSGTPKGNPFNADGAGYAAFYAEAGLYSIEASSGSTSFAFTNVAIGEAAGRDVGISEGNVLDRAAGDALYATVRKYNVDDTAPTASDDITQGYNNGSQWLRPTSGELYQLFDENTGDWRLIDTGLTSLGAMATKDEGTGAGEFRSNQDAEAYFASQAGLDATEAALQADIDGKVTDAPVDGNLYGRKDAGWEAITGGGGLSADVAETINEPWAFAGGLQGGRYTYGQPTVTLLGTVPTAYSATFSNAYAGGTISLTASTSAADETDSARLNYFNSMNDIDSSTWAVGDKLFIHNVVADAAGYANSYVLSFEKTATDIIKTEVSYMDNGAGSSSIIHRLGDDGEASLEFNGLPLDGRILTEQVTANRTLTKADIGKILICTGSSDITLTVPVGLQDKSFNCEIVNETTANNVTLVDDGTSNLVNKDSQFKVIPNGGVVRILPTLTTDRYRLSGDTQA